MKYSIVAMALAALLASTACQREEPPSEERQVMGREESLLSFKLEEPGLNPMSKSVIGATDFESGIRNVLILLVGSDGHWRKTYSPDGAAGLQEMLILADGVTSYDIYAFVNMGNVSLPTEAGGHIHPEAFAYTLPDRFESLGDSGLPMCGHSELEASDITPGGISSVTIDLHRLLSKVVVTVNKSGMLSGASDGSALQGGTLKVRQVSKVLRPFAADADRRAQAASEVYTADTDYHTFTVGENSLVTSDVVLYVAENRQGTGSGATQANKTPASGREGLATYLEYTAAKNGSSDGVSGDMTYRVYLGENETDDFNVIGDKIYNATLNLSWNGIWEGSWRVTSESFNDSRQLVISKSADPADKWTTSNTKSGAAKVRKATPTEFYMNYFVNGSISHGRKDMNQWPYGWVIYIDGVAVELTGTSGTIKDGGDQPLYLWTYDAATDKFTLATAPGAPASTEIHTLQVKTGDGRKESDIVYFTTSIPFEFRWRADGEPNHVAQRGILEALDADTHAVDPEGVFHLKDGYSSKVRMSDNGDGTAVVELLDGFTSVEDAISIKDADGDRECKVPLEARVPWFEVGTISPSVNFVDAASRIRFTYYEADASGAKTATAMKVIDNGTSTTAIATGEDLDLKLVDELIAPVLGAGGSSLLGYGRSLDPDGSGSFNIRVFINTYAGVPALIGTGKTFDVGKTSIGMPSVTGGHGQAADEQTFTAYNPWRLITSVAQGGVMNDYTLYNEPARNGNKMAVGWSSTPQSAPSETAEWTTNIGNVIIESADHLRYNASFQDGAGYLGSKVCSHVGNGPSNVGPDFMPSTNYFYQLMVKVTNLSNYDWKTIGDWLFYDHGHYIPVEWVNPSATEAARKALVDDVFSSNPDGINITGWYESAADAWVYANLPKGVSQATPGAVNGATFFTRQHTEVINSTWTLRYSMAGLKEADVTTHNAGKIDVVLRIVNPFNSASPSLDKKVAEAYVKLHLYVWPAPYEVSTGPYPWCSTTGHGWTYSVFPYCYTGGKKIYGLESIGRNFFSKPILLPATETYTSNSTTFLVGSAASVGAISRDTGRTSYVGSATYQFRNNSAFSDDDSQARKMSKLLDYMSDYQTSAPFKLRIPDDITRNELRRSESAPGGGWTYVYDNNVSYEGLNSNSVLGSGTYYRADEYTLYYDPTGNTRTYTYDTPESSPGTTDKLFVIHIGGNNLSLRYGHYFDPSWF